MARLARGRPGRGGARARPLPAREAGRARPDQRPQPAVQRQHRLPQHHSAEPGGRLSGQSRDREPPARLRALERDGDGGPRQPQGRRPRRPHRLLRLVLDAVRRRHQPLLPGPASRPQGDAARELRRPGLRPGAQLAGHLRALLPRGPAQRRAARQLPPGGRRPGPVVLPASVADAGLLAVPDGVDGAGADHGALPGALHALPGAPRAAAGDRPQGLGLPRRRRVRRARDPGRDLAGVAASGWTT